MKLNPSARDHLSSFTPAGDALTSDTFMPFMSQSGFMVVRYSVFILLTKTRGVSDWAEPLCGKLLN